jgi:hypothetical protein
MADLGDLETIDPRKAVIHGGFAMILRGLLATMYAYCEGPPSSPQVERDLGNRLIEASRVLHRYGRHVARGSVGNVGARMQ